MLYFDAYNGSKPYVFVSYAHTDINRVYPLISALHLEGYRLWYDQGIKPTQQWRGVINEHIRDCSLFLIFVTKNSMKSREVIKECTYAINLNKTLHVVFLEKVPEKSINSSLIADFTNGQCVYSYELDSSVFSKRLRSPLHPYRDIPTADKSSKNTPNSVNTAPVAKSPSLASKAHSSSLYSEIKQVWNSTKPDNSRLALQISVSVAAFLFFAVHVSITMIQRYQLYSTVDFHTLFHPASVVCCLMCLAVFMLCLLRKQTDYNGKQLKKSIIRTNYILFTITDILSCLMCFFSFVYTMSRHSLYFYYNRYTVIVFILHAVVVISSLVLCSAANKAIVSVISGKVRIEFDPFVLSWLYFMFVLQVAALPFYLYFAPKGNVEIFEPLLVSVCYILTQYLLIDYAYSLHKTIDRLSKIKVRV